MDYPRAYVLTNAESLQKKHRFLKVLFLLCFWMIAAPAFAQRTPAPAYKPYVARDPYVVTLETAQAAQKKGDLEGAYKTLRQYIIPRKSDRLPAEMLWYAAQVANLSNEPDVAVEYYTRAISVAPQNQALIDDYGGFLMNRRRYKDAIEILTPHADSNNTLTRFYLAKTYYWQGDYRKAKAVFKTFSPQERNYDYIKELRRDFDLAKAAQLEVGFSAHTDDQPLRYTGQNIRFSKKWNNWFTPIVSGALQQFQSDSGGTTASSFHLGNRFHINPIKTDFTVQMGRFGLNNQSQILYGMWLYTQVGKAFSVEANLSREPYLFTLASSANLLTFADRGFALNLNSKWLLARYQYRNQVFENNQINNSSFWFLFPIINKNSFKIRLGYAYQYSNADSSRYVPKYGNVGQNVEGMYRPYFTPINQQVNSALVQIQAQPSSKLNATLSVSFPLSAQIDNPYLNTTSDTLGNITLARGFLTTKYSPVEVKASLGYKISRAVDLAASYQYANLFFYQGHTVGLSTRILLK